MRKSIALAILLLGACPAFLVADCATSSCSTTCSAYNGSCCGCPCSGKTYFEARPIYQSYRPEYWTGFRNDRMIANEDGIGGAFEAVALGAISSNNNQLAQYFLPNCKNFLTVQEAVLPGVTDIAGADLVAQNFNIDTVNGNFESIVCFQASQSVAGVGLHYKQGFWFNDDRTEWYYLDIATSVQRVKNSMSISEVIVNDGGGANTAVNSNAVGSITAAFAQSAWNYGKIDCNCSLTKTGLSDVELKLGKELLWRDHCHFAGYFGFLIPTGNKAEGVHVFEPIVGHGKYFGLLFGGEGGFELWSNKNDSWHLNVELACQGIYMFSKLQTRSFDLKGKPWSRYQEVYLNEAQATQAHDLSLAGNPQAVYLNTPGINVFTQPVNVSPGFIFNTTTVFMIAHDCGFDAEAGYNIYARHAECVQLACPWNPGPALKAAEGAGQTNPVRKIDGNPFLQNDITVTFDDYAESIITADQLDLNSAAHPGYLSYIAHLAVGYRWDNISYPVHLNVGGSYEFAEKTFAAMNRWVAWAKAGVAF